MRSAIAKLCSPMDGFALKMYSGGVIVLWCLLDVVAGAVIFGRGWVVFV